MDIQVTDEHYIIDGQKYTRVSRFLDSLEVDFTPSKKRAIASAVAKKDGREAEDVLDEWALNNEAANLYGTAIHKAIECWIRYGKEPKNKHLASAVSEFWAYAPERELIHPEIVVYSDELKLAGTIDQLVKTETGWEVWDVKTNGEMTDKKIKRYSLQLNTYRHLLELKNKIVEDMWLLHWDGTDFHRHQIGHIDINQQLKQWQTKSS